MEKNNLIGERDYFIVFLLKPKILSGTQTQPDLYPITPKFKH